MTDEACGCPSQSEDEGIGRVDAALQTIPDYKHQSFLDKGVHDDVVIPTDQVSINLDSFTRTVCRT